MNRQAKLDAQGLLLEHGFCDYGPDGLAVAEDFALTPGRWRWDGRQWVAVATPQGPALCGP